MGYNAPENVTTSLYKALIRSNIEYSSPVWCPGKVTQIQALEKIQRNFSSYIMHYPDLDYASRIKTLNLLPLSYRREILDLSITRKAMSKLNGLNLENIVQKYIPDDRLRSSTIKGPLLKPQAVRTECYMQSYANRIVTIWNNLPYEIRKTSDVNEFKNSVVEFYENKFSEQFDRENICTWTSYCRCYTCVSSKIVN